MEEKYSGALPNLSNIVGVLSTSGTIFSYPANFSELLFCVPALSFFVLYFAFFDGIFLISSINLYGS